MTCPYLYLLALAAVRQGNPGLGWDRFSGWLKPLGLGRGRRRLTEFTWKCSGENRVQYKYWGQNWR